MCRKRLRNSLDVGSTPTTSTSGAPRTRGIAKGSEASKLFNMRISRKRHKEEPKKKFLSNESITAPQIFVLGIDNQPRGIMNTAEAVRLARSEELDLVIINPKAEPPIAKMLDFGQFQYQQEKEARLRKAHQHVIKTKNIRFSLRIGEHDRDIKKNQAVDFLNGGDKVKVEIFLKGRELQQGQLALDLFKSFIADINAVVPTRFDQTIERQKNIISAVITKT